MATELQDTLTRIVNKSNILIEKYRALDAQREHLEGEVQRLTQDVERLTKDNEQLRQANEYLTMARSLVPDTSKAQQARAKISTMVREIDKCIDQLNE